MYSEYMALLFLFLFAILIGAGFIALSSLLKPIKRTKVELSPYECGINQSTVPRSPFNVKFFAVALAFLLFDVEVSVLYPWAGLFRKFVADGMGQFALIEGAIFIGVLAVGLIYILKMGVMEWKK